MDLLLVVVIVAVIVREGSDGGCSKIWRGGVMRSSKIGEEIFVGWDTSDDDDDDDDKWLKTKLLLLLDESKIREEIKIG